jgi:hypothetical protein
MNQFRQAVWPGGPVRQPYFPTRFLAPIDCLKFPAQLTNFWGGGVLGMRVNMLIYDREYIDTLHMHNIVYYCLYIKMPQQKWEVQERHNL